MRELAAALPRTLAAKIPSRPVRVSLTPRMRRRVACAALLAIALAALYQLWFRDSSLVAVSSVEVTGLTTKDGPRIRSALTAAAEEMTTLHVRVDEIEQTARRFPVIGSIEVESDFPHGLRIAVAERRPAALVAVDGVPVPVAGDGVVLRGLQPPPGLPLLRSERPLSDGRVTDPRTRRALLVSGAAPAPLQQRIDRIGEDAERGIVLALEDGPDIVFGDADRALAKWAAAARVMADPEAQGASYIDVRLPDRPVAGGLPVETIEPVAPAGDPVPAPLTPDAGSPAEATPVDPATAPTPDPATPPAAAGPPPASAPAETAPPQAATPPAAGTTGGVTGPQP